MISFLPPAGRQLLLKAVNRVWTELMHSKRQMLEDIFKVSLPCNDRGHVDISTARPALEEPALKSWQNHLGEGKNSEYIQPNRTHKGHCCTALCENNSVIVDFCVDSHRYKQVTADILKWFLFYSQRVWQTTRCSEVLKFIYSVTQNP